MATRTDICVIVPAFAGLDAYFRSATPNRVLESNGHVAVCFELDDAEDHWVQDCDDYGMPKGGMFWKLTFEHPVMTEIDDMLQLVGGFCAVLRDGEITHHYGDPDVIGNVDLGFVDGLH